MKGRTRLLPISVIRISNWYNNRKTVLEPDHENEKGYLDLQISRYCIKFCQGESFGSRSRNPSPVRTVSGTVTPSSRVSRTLPVSVTRPEKRGSGSRTRRFGLFGVGGRVVVALFGSLNVYFSGPGSSHPQTGSRGLFSRGPTGAGAEGPREGTLGDDGWRGYHGVTKGVTPSPSLPPTTLVPHWVLFLSRSPVFPRPLRVTSVEGPDNG